VDEATSTLHTLAGGDQAAAAALFELVYPDLRALAGSYFRRQPSDHTLQPTALVHEAYLRLIDQSHAQWNSRAHFFAVAAMAMRQVLVNHARKRSSLKRGGDRRRQSLEAGVRAASGMSVTDLIALNEAMNALAALDERKSRVVELRIFGGLTMDEIAHVLGVSKTTVEGDWRLARAWLAKRLSEDVGDDAPSISED